jgi:hypothetical protein
MTGRRLDRPSVPQWQHHVRQPERDRQPASRNLPGIAFAGGTQASSVALYEGFRRRGFGPDQFPD